MATTEQISGSKGWISYRPEIKVLDVTIRDGGLMNNHQFNASLVKAVYRTACEAGVDYMEIGYKGSRKVFSNTENGPWKFCDEDALRDIVGDKSGGTKLSVMADAERTDYHTDILPRDKSVIDMIRVAAYIHQIPSALDMIKDAHDKGYETTINLMAISTVPECEIDDALEVLAKSEVDVFYLVDSFGTLYSEQIQSFMQKFLKFAKAGGKEVGIHTHNNCHLAYANTIEAIICGANYLDASLAGLGRGAGNCQMELLLSFLHNPKYRLRPLLQCIQDNIEPLRKDFFWGYSIPYMISGILNRHPREAIEFMENGSSSDIVKFYDTMTAEG
ncbi:MAG: aldolase catalytic domain-containing protein [bacterium]